jgi:tetratricopeptide (TPR) repeat protein
MMLLVACTGSKKMAKKGLKLDDAGLYAEAAGLYFESLRRNRTNVDAKIGLKKTGQRLLNDQLSDFFKASNTGQKALAVDTYNEAVEYANRVKSLGVILDIPDHYQTDYEEVKSSYLLDLYEEGQNFMAQENYKEAERVFARIGELEPEFKDASSLQSVAYLEPLYKTGKAALQAGHFRKAYNDLQKVIDRDPAYKDAFALREDAISKGRYAIAIPAFSDKANNRDVTSKVSLYALNEMANMNDPFIKIVDRDNLERILKEQHLALSGVLDEASVVEVGNILGAQAVLLGDVVDYKEYLSTLQKQAMAGFTSYTVRELNKETNEYRNVTKYRKTKYYEYTRSNSARVTVNFKLVSMETGEILMSQVIEDVVSDNVHYAKFDGDLDKLFPSKDGRVNTSSRARKSLRALLAERSDLRSLADMRNEVLRKAGSDIARGVQSEIERIIP